MRVRTLLLIAVAIGSALLPSTAHAGGWWAGIDLDGQYLGIGETLTVRSQVMFRNMDVAEEARTTDYHAYLVRGVNTQALERAMSRPEPKRWWTPPAEMTLIGDVELSRWDSNLAMSTAHLTIPEVPVGRYDLMLCDTGCRVPLGDLIPLPVHVTADALAAQTARKLRATNARLDLALARVRSDFRQTNSQVNAAQEAAAQSADMAGRLQEKIASLRTSVPSTPWMAYAAWFLGGVATMLVAMRFRRRVRHVNPITANGPPPTVMTAPAAPFTRAGRTSARP